MVVRGLPPNRAVLMAVAAYDSAGALVADLGESGPEVVTCAPLPLLLLHANLAITAGNLGALDVGRASSALLTRHFVKMTEERPLWEEDPSDCTTLHAARVRDASPQLLRAFAHATYVGAARLVAGPPAPAVPLSGAVPGPLRTPYLEGQVARVRAAKRLLLAMHAAATINDQQLLAEGAVRVHNLLAPLTEMPRKSPLLAKPLAACCALLRGLADVALHPCRAAMPAATHLTLNAIQVSV